MIKLTTYIICLYAGIILFASRSIVYGETSALRASYERACSQAELPDPTKSFRLDPHKVFMLVNNHRIANNLPAFQEDEKLCTLARAREPDLYDEIFVNGNIHGGLMDMDLPYRVVENMKYGHTEEEVFNWWLSSPLHRKSIEGDYNHSCVTCSGKICIQLFSNFIPR